MTEEIGNRMCIFRIVLGMKKQHFADKCGISVAQVIRMEKAQRDVHISTLIKIVETFDLSLNWLVTGNGDMFLDKGEIK